MCIDRTYCSMNAGLIWPPAGQVNELIRTVFRANFATFNCARLSGRRAHCSARTHLTFLHDNSIRDTHNRWISDFQAQVIIPLDRHIQRAAFIPAQIKSNHMQTLVSAVMNNFQDKRNKSRLSPPSCSVNLRPDNNLPHSYLRTPGPICLKI